MNPLEPVKTLKGFACPYCGWVTTQKKEVQFHIERCMTQNKKKSNVAPEKLNNYCRFCRTDFPTSEGLLAHKSSLHPQCGVCGTTLSSNTYVGRHYMQHEKMISKPCFWCKKKHDTLVEVAIHCHEEHLPCEICGAQLSSTYTRTAHFNEKHGGDLNRKNKVPFPCQTCHTSFGTIVEVVAHFSEKHSTRLYQRARARPHAMAYTRNYSGIGSMDSDGWAPVPVKGGFACPRCGWVSCTDYVVKAHYNKVHASDGIGEKRTQCNICKEEFPSMDEYFDHRKKHPICPVCRQVMVDGVILHKHLDEKHPICVICGKLLDNFLKMNMHSASHAEAKCHRCEKTFPTMIALKTHYSDNHKEKRCHLCDTYHDDKPKLYKHLENDHYYFAAAHLAEDTGPKHSHNYMKPQSTMPSMGFVPAGSEYDETMYINFPLDGNSEIQELDGSDDVIANLISATPGEPRPKRARIEDVYAEQITAAVNAAMGGNCMVYMSNADEGGKKQGQEQKKTVKEQEEEEEEEQDDEEEDDDDDDDDDEEEEEDKDDNDDESEEEQEVSKKSKTKEIGQDNKQRPLSARRRSPDEGAERQPNSSKEKSVKDSNQHGSKGPVILSVPTPGSSQHKQPAKVKEDKEENATSCSMCGISFLRPGILRAHMKMVHGAGGSSSSLPLPPALPQAKELKVLCKHCGKNVPNGLPYNDHMKTHPACEVCGMRFRGRGEMERHKVITHPLCYVCGSLLSSVMMVSEHYAAHDVAKCYLCGKPFDNMSTLMKHYEEEHGPCRVCGDSFTSKSALDKHELNNHKKAKK